MDDESDPFVINIFDPDMGEDSLSEAEDEDRVPGAQVDPDTSEELTQTQLNDESQCIPIDVIHRRVNR